MWKEREKERERERECLENGLLKMRAKRNQRQKITKNKVTDRQIDRQTELRELKKRLKHATQNCTKLYKENVLKIKRRCI